MRKLFGLSFLMVVLVPAMVFAADDFNVEFYARYFVNDPKTIKDVAWFQFWAKYHGRGDFINIDSPVFERDIAIEKATRCAMGDEAFGAIVTNDDALAHGILVRGALARIFPDAHRAKFDSYHADFVARIETARAKMIDKEEISR